MWKKERWYIMENLETQKRDTRPYDSSLMQQVSLMKSQQSDLLRWVLDYTKEIDELRRDLRGETKTDMGIIIDENKRRLNDLGVSEIIRRVRLPFSKGTVLSNMSQDDIEKDATDFNIQLALDCNRNYDEWGFKSYTDRTSIIVSTSWLYYKLLLRAKNALQLKQLSESIERQEKVIYGGQRDKAPSWWQFWKPNKKYE